MQRMMIVAASMACLCAMSAFADSYGRHLQRMQVDDATKTISLYMDDGIAEGPLKEKEVRKIYRKTVKEVRKALPEKCMDYDVRIYVKGAALETLVGQSWTDGKEKTENARKRRRKGWWGDIAWEGRPWVTNTSRPASVTQGLQGRHVALWASHGRYYDKNKDAWRWQRPNMFCTNEDLFTQTIVVPYLIPMLEKAGANVFTPRERDWQKNEVIVDNDSAANGYSEVAASGRWRDAGVRGFAMPGGEIEDGYNPFEHGSVRWIAATSKESASVAVYQPDIPEAGRYAVYVSYATMENSVDDAHYTVWHQGQRTDFTVNQQMGGGTWVYLGTFNFVKGTSEYNRVEVSARSAGGGVVTTDAVRFGGGMGNVARGGTTSGLPRCLEGARYYAQWAGAPYSVYSLYNGEDDYKDDINSRSLMINWIAGGSPFVPGKEGKGVPIDLCLAVHSDAGYNADMKSVYGSLAICTTDFNNGRLDAGKERSHSKEFCQMLLEQSKKDITSQYGEWTWRDLYDRNYSETRLPAMPSAIFETLSHQSFPDMKLGHDPGFKFTLARSIYKSILRFEAKAHGEKAVVAPLAPVNFSVTLDGQGNALLNWVPQKDREESSADARSYNVYMAMGGFDYDNGRNVEKTHFSQPLERDLLYRFKVTAVNAGGESFPTEELCVVWHGPEAKNVLIVNGFQRLSSPAVIDGYGEKGFDLNDDPGLSYGMTAGWAGKQQVFSTATAGKEGRGTFAYCDDEIAGYFVAGNSFDYVAEHTMAALSAGRYNIVSCSKNVVEWGDLELADYDVVDLIVGNEKYVPTARTTYRAFTRQMQKQLRAYLTGGRGALLVSGSYICSDMQAEEEKNFLSAVLHIAGTSTVRDANSIVKGLQQTVQVTNKLNQYHYATVQSDVIRPTGGGAFVAMQYADGQTAAVACPADSRTFAMGFPLECITHSAQRASVMRGILDFLVKR